MVVPADPADGATRAVELIWKKKFNEFVKRELALKENLRTSYVHPRVGTMYGGVLARLEALNSYSAMSEEFDSLALLKAIKRR
jgi:hypothetical protein